ncbi:MAG: M14 family zinc carboxypeptidase [Candidatus Aminicenantes bacterium]
MVYKQDSIKSGFVFITASILILSSVLFSQQAVDEKYTQKIKEYTTEDFFLTELVDHLPASDTVPNPKDVLGVIAGAPNALHYTAEIEKYMKAVADVSPRMIFFSIGKSDEGKNMFTVALSSEGNINRIERIKEILSQLADPRRLSESEAEVLLNEGIPIYWITGGLHSPECGSPEMLMELAYRIAVDESEFYRSIRDNMVILMTPVLEVDGRDRYVDTYLYKKEHDDKKTIPLIYWGNYVGHDNNRDNIGLALTLTNNILSAYFEWHPLIMHDLHESVPYLYTSTGTGPYNAWLDPITIHEWHELAYVEVSEMNKQGVPGVWTHGFYNGWAPSYAFYIAMYHNSVGKFYETFGGTGADTLVRRVGAQSQRAWYRQNPPLPSVKWSFRNNINLQQSALLYALKHVADNQKKFLTQFYLKSKRSVAKAVNEGPAAWVIPEDGKKPLAAAGLVNLLRKHGVEIHRAKKSFAIKKTEYPAQSYIVRMDQPYSRCADMLLDTQYFNPNDPAPYDDTGWTLGPLHDVKTVRIMDKEILNIPMNLITDDVYINGEVFNTKKTAAFIINHRAENALMKLRYELKDYEIRAAESDFKIKDKSFNKGSFIIPVDNDNPEFLSNLESAVKKFGFEAWGVNEIPEVESHTLAVPRIAILHTWIYTQNEGWFRIAFEKLGIPYSYISSHDIRETKNLKDKYDVIVFPPVMLGKAQRLVNGIGGEEPIPWKKMENYPNLGGPDSTDDIRGGMGLEGVLHLKDFIENGGLFIPITSSARIPIDYGMVESVAVVNPKKLKMSGSVLQARFTDLKSPITYGYGKTLGVYFSGSPVLEAGITAVTGGMDISSLFGGGGEGRPSGRGGLDDPDVIQGRPYELGKTRAGGTGIPPEYKDMMALFMPPDLQKVRVILRFAGKKDLLISGMLEGAEELQNKPAVIDVPVGKGHVLFFAINPMWRYETLGSFSLIFNAAMNYDHLDAGRRNPKSDQEKDK